MLNSPRIVFALAQRTGNVWSVDVVRLLAVFWGSLRLCCRASCRLLSVVLLWHLDVATYVIADQ